MTVKQINGIWKQVTKQCQLINLLLSSCHIMYFVMNFSQLIAKRTNKKEQNSARFSFHLTVSLLGHSVIYMLISINNRKFLHRKIEHCTRHAINSKVSPHHYDRCRQHILPIYFSLMHYINKIVPNTIPLHKVHLNSGYHFTVFRIVRFAVVVDDFFPSLF